MIKKNPLYLVLAMAMMVSSLPALVSCNKDKDDEETYSYSTSTQTTLVTGFALQANNDVLINLDSVHFTVDYDRGLIYNADSLPVGTDISALKVTVHLLNAVSSAVFNITDATKQADTTINYSSSMNTSIDFTGKTILTVTSQDESRVKDYEVKVLVHKVNPDSLVWPQSWRRDLPGYKSGIQHKAVMLDGAYRIMTHDGAECRLLTALAPNQAIWDSEVVELPFTPDVSSLVSTGETLYMLDIDGVLYSSDDGRSWTSCGVTWHTLLGCYEDCAMGIIRGSDGGYYHDEFPHGDDFTVTAVEEGFPVSNASGMVEVSNDWTQASQAMIVGGKDSNGNVLNAVWGYDGTRWGKISNNHGQELPGLCDATLFRYYTYTQLKGVRRYGLQNTWFIMGGQLADGSLNDAIYLSNSQGVTWASGDTTYFQPSHMPKFYGAQAFVHSETMTASGANYLPRRVQSLSATWDCPYLYLFGGYGEDDALLPNVWRGVYIRLTNSPID